MADQVQPIIIKKIKKGGHAHHGGAWKVAYADFVTAMMAFFLLLWLLSVTTPEKRAAIADYFTPTIGIKDSKGIGVNGGRNTQLKKGQSLSNLTAPGIVIGQVQQGPVAQMPEDVKNPKDNQDSPDAAKNKKDDSQKKDVHEEQDAQDSEQFTATERDLNQALQNDQDLKQLQNNVQVEQSPEGLKINLIDDPKQPMFAAGGSALTEAGKKVLDSMANIIAKTPNKIAILGNTDAEGPSVNPRYTNWELSADRANAVRRALVTTQIGTDRVAKVIGMADRDLLIKEEPNNPRNRRVTVILIRGSYARDPNQVQPASRPVLSVGDAQLKTLEDKQAAAPTTPQPAKPSIFDLPVPGKETPAIAPADAGQPDDNTSDASAPAGQPQAEPDKPAATPDTQQPAAAPAASAPAAQ